MNNLEKDTIKWRRKETKTSIRVEAGMIKKKRKRPRWLRVWMKTKRGLWWWREKNLKWKERKPEQINKLANKWKRQFVEKPDQTPFINKRYICTCPWNLIGLRWRNATMKKKKTSSFSLSLSFYKHFLPPPSLSLSLSSLSLLMSFFLSLLLRYLSRFSCGRNRYSHLIPLSHGSTQIMKKALFDGRITWRTASLPFFLHISPWRLRSPLKTINPPNILLFPFIPFPLPYR